MHNVASGDSSILIWISWLQPGSLFHAFPVHFKAALVGDVHFVSSCLPLLSTYSSLYFLDYLYLHSTGWLASLPWLESQQNCTKLLQVTWCAPEKIRRGISQKTPIAWHGQYGNVSAVSEVLTANQNNEVGFLHIWHSCFAPNYAG